MKMLTVMEPNGQLTRMIIPVDSIADAMHDFYRNGLDLIAMIETEEEAKKCLDGWPIDSDEEWRGQNYLNEWRAHSAYRLRAVA